MEAEEARRLAELKQRTASPTNEAARFALLSVGDVVTCGELNPWAIVKAFKAASAKCASLIDCEVNALLRFVWHLHPS